MRCQSCTDADDADIGNDGARVLLVCTSSFVIAAVRRFFLLLLFVLFSSVNFIVVASPIENQSIYYCTLVKCVSKCL